MTDEQLSDDLPFMLVLYRFIRGAGYSVVSTQDFPFGEVTKGNLLEALKDLEASGEVLANLPKPPKPFSIYDEVEPPEVLPDWLLVLKMVSNIFTLINILLIKVKSPK